LNLKTGLDRGGGCQARAFLMAAKNIGFGGGHSGVGAGCSSGDDGVAGATGSPRLGELGVVQLLPLVEAWIGESARPPR